nr:RHS repeat-associated core domain-containing protein [uncultured Carboxylicivirga sp.]
MRGFLVLAIADYEIYHKFANDVLETERTTVNISDDKKKIATAETLTVDQGSLTVNPVAVIRYQYDNHLGSASLELDEQANIISYEEYHPFGTTSYRSGRTETETSQKRYKYVGKERDEETGLYYYGFRYYAAWLCRFVSVDPLQFEYPHYTPFQYAGNKPISYIDLDGLEEATSYLMEDLTTRIDATKVETPIVTPLEQLRSSKFVYVPINPNRTQIGPYNPEGFNKDFIKANDKYWKRKYKFDQQLKIAQSLHPVSYGGNGFGIGLARDPFIQESAIYVATLGTGNLVSRISSSAWSTFGTKAFLDMAGQGIIKGDIRKIDVFDGFVSGINIPNFYKDILKSSFDMSYNKGPYIKDNLMDFGVELGIRQTLGVTFKKPGNFSEDLWVDLSKKYIKGGVMEIYQYEKNK